MPNLVAPYVFEKESVCDDVSLWRLPSGNFRFEIRNNQRLLTAGIYDPKAASLDVKQGAIFARWQPIIAIELAVLSSLVSL